MKKIKLVDICNPKQWKTIPMSELLDEGYPVYGANGIIGYYSEFNHENPVIAITCRGATCGSINMTVPKAYVTGNAMCLDDVSSNVDTEYLYYCLKKYNFSNVISGTAQPQITRQGLKNINISLCSYNEQIEIVNRLKKTEYIIKLRKQEIQSLDNLIKANYTESFVNEKNDWDEVSIADICADMRTGPFGSALHHDEFVDEGIFVLGIDNAVDNKFSYNRMRYITEEKYEKLKRYTVYPGDVIITIMGTVGRSAVIPEDMPKAINTKHLACLTPNIDIVDPYFLVSTFQTHPAIRRQLETKSKGAIMDGLNLTIIKGLRFRLPPLGLQKAFTDSYKKIVKSKYVIQKSLDETSILFDALLQQYFG